MITSGGGGHAPPAIYQEQPSLSALKLQSPRPDATMSQPAPAPQNETATSLIAAPTYRDVLNGRGQGVQRHPGNVKYRALVYVNKVRTIYPFYQCATWWIAAVLYFFAMFRSNIQFSQTGTLCQVPQE